jgi:5-methylcytosine-specific restriction endonuclease McrA
MYDNLRARKFKEALTKEQRKRLAKKETTRVALGWEECELWFSLGFFRIELSKVLDAKKECRYCGIPLKIGNISADHRIPIARAEEFAVTLVESMDVHPDAEHIVHKSKEEVARLIAVHNFENLDLEVCDRCNRRKGDLTSVEFSILVRIVTGFPTAASRYVFTKLGSVPFRWHGKGKADAATAN